MPKPFQNRVLLLPKEIIVEINTYADKGYKARAVISRVLRSYKDAELPHLNTIERYIKWYVAQREQPEEGSKEGGDTQGDINKYINNPDISVDSKSKVLQGLLYKCIGRINSLAAGNKNPMFPTPGLDDKIQKYTKEIRALIEVMVKLSGKLEKDEHVITKEELDNSLQDIMYCVKRAADRTFPERATQFAKMLEEELDK